MSKFFDELMESGKHRKNKNRLEIIPPISGSILAVYLKNSWNNAI